MNRGHWLRSAPSTCSPLPTLNCPWELRVGRGRTPCPRGCASLPLSPASVPPQPPLPPTGGDSSALAEGEPRGRNPVHQPLRNVSASSASASNSGRRVRDSHRTRTGKPCAKTPLALWSRADIPSGAGAEAEAGAGQTRGTPVRPWPAAEVASGAGAGPSAAHSPRPGSGGQGPGDAGTPRGHREWEGGGGWGASGARGWTRRW